MQSGKIYGYARVSSKHQNEERQLIALRAFGIRDRDIYCDRQSGKDFDRPNYQRLLLRLLLCRLCQRYWNGRRGGYRRFKRNP